MIKKDIEDKTLYYYIHPYTTMTRNPIDYSKSVFYKIVCKDLTITDLYVGSTTDFKSRKSQHKSACKCDTNDFKIYKFIREQGGWENWDMIMISRQSCTDKLEVRAIERGYIETLNATLNSNVPGRTQSDWNDDNIVELTSYRSNYYQLNREKIIKAVLNRAVINKEEIAEYQSTYRKKNLEAIKEQQVLYNQANKVKIREQQKLYNEVNKVEIKEKKALYNQANREEIKRKQNIRSAKFREKKKLLKQESLGDLI